MEKQTTAAIKAAAKMDDFVSSETVRDFKPKFDWLDEVVPGSNLVQSETKNGGIPQTQATNGNAHPAIPAVPKSTV